MNFTPYYRWKHDHAIHHATAGDLDRRGTGDVYTMTVREYLAAPWWKKTAYRIMRNPFALLGVGPLLVFVITQSSACEGTDGRTSQCLVDEFRTGGGDHTAVLADRVEDISHGATADPHDQFNDRDLALLRPAQF